MVGTGTGDAGRRLPVYRAMNDPAAAVIGKSIRDVIDDRTALHAVSYDTKRRAGDEVNPATIRFPNLPGSAADGQRLIEPSPAYRLKDGTLVRFWRNYGDDTHKHYIWRLYVSSVTTTEQPGPPRTHGHPLQQHAAKHRQPCRMAASSHS